MEGEAMSHLPDAPEPADAETLYRTIQRAYNSYRTAEMNRRYYGYRLASWKRTSSILNWGVALGSTTSAIAALPLWQTPGGKIAWSALAFVAAGAAIAQSVVDP